MCYMMFGVTENEIDDRIVKNYRDHFSIYIDNISPYIKNRSGANMFYSINRQCACDFLQNDERKNNRSEMMALLKNLFDTGKGIFVIIEDKGQYGNLIENLQQVLNGLPEQQINLDLLLENYPSRLEADTAYRLV
ncbi:hypothetical protein [Paenibacillus hamazuiensis]|uniref:hypothetical protein n=1 Tax=Paenibacillus hamazuiensis TaxID=2936508 RepID=UPI00200F67AA|nr:hypothetical protein [Paenibacillus hamazuiensis]